MIEISNIELLYDDWKRKDTSHFVLSYWENGKKIVEQYPKTFYPYFYVNEDAFISDSVRKLCHNIESGFTTWNFKKAQKLLLEQIDRETFLELRDSFKTTYEDDVIFITRFLVDKNVSYSTTQRLGIIDIEVMKGATSLKPLKANEPITVIVLHDSFTKKYFIFTWSPLGKEDKYTKENQIYYISKTEREMLLKFCAFLSYAKFDIFTGYNVIDYDLPYILTRLKNLKISSHKLSYLGRAMAFRGYDGMYLKIFGTAVIDMMAKIKERFRLNSYSLKFVTSKLLDHSKMDTVFITPDTFQEKFDDLLEYCISDVSLVLELDEKYKLLNPLFTLQQVVPLPLEDLKYMSRIGDAYMLKKYHDKIVFPSKRKNPHKSYKGGFVAIPKPGFYDNVLYLDFKSHYLSVISTFNISPELKIGSEETTSFRMDHKGLLVEIVEEIRKEREHYKELRNTFPKDSKEWIKYDALQSTFKTLSLTFYGMFGFRSFRLFDPDVAAFITKKARELLKELIDFYEDSNFVVIYGDTDSVFIEGSNKKAEALELVTKFNNLMGERYQRKDVPSPFVEVEDVFKRVIFFDKKKKYIGIREDGSLYMKGVDPIRKDYPTYFKTQLEKFIMIILTAEKQDIVPKLDQLEQEILNEFRDLPLEEICEWKGISMPFKQYKVKTPHLRAAKFSNDVLKTHYQAGDRVPFLWVTGDARTTVVALPEENPEEIRDDFIWDYDRIFDKLWVKKKEMFLELLECENKK